MKKKKQMKKLTLLYLTIIIVSLLFIIGCMLLAKVYNDNHPEEEIVKEEKLEDTVAPTIEGVKDLEVYTDEEIDLTEGITVKDNVTSDINVEIEGNYDITIGGTYNLKYVATDKAGNTTYEKFKLTVINKIEVKNGLTYIKGIPIVNKTYGVDTSYVPENLVSVGSTQLVDYVAEAFNNLVSGAANDGIKLFGMTGYRSIGFQTSIYNGYLKTDTKESVDTYSARPGYSEHHTGLAIDVNSLEQAWGDTEEGIWLKNNCYKYGFVIRYPEGKEDITGYMYEPWHIRYVGTELAEKLYNNGEWISLEEYLDITSVYE